MLAIIVGESVFTINTSSANIKMNAIIETQKTNLSKYVFFMCFVSSAMRFINI